MLWLLFVALGHGFYIFGVLCLDVCCGRVWWDVTWREAKCQCWCLNNKSGRCCFDFDDIWRTTNSVVPWCFCTRGSRTHLSVSRILHMCAFKMLTELASENAQDVFKVAVHHYYSGADGGAWAMCVVTLDPQDHHGANPQFIYFFSCWITNSHVVLVPVFSITPANMTSHPCTHGQKYHWGNHASIHHRSFLFCLFGCLFVFWNIVG